MAFLAPCSPNDVKAVYVVKDKILTVFAQGEVPQWYIGPFIKQATFFGGLKFELLSYAGGILDPNKPKTKHFDVHFKLPIQLPNHVVGGEYITFATQQVPNGFLVKVEYDGLLPEPGTEQTEQTEPVLPKSVLPPIDVLVAGEGVVFSIDAQVDLTPMTEVGIKFDTEALKLVTAGTVGLKVVWKFKAIKLGKTLVNVTTTWNKVGETIQGYIVKVVVEDESKPTT